MTEVQVHKLSMLFYLIFVLCISVIVLFTFRITTLRTNQIDAQIRSEIAKQPELIPTPEPMSAALDQSVIKDSTFKEFLELNPQLAVPKEFRE